MARRKKNPLTGGAIATVAAMTGTAAAWGYLLGKVQQVAERFLMEYNFGRTGDFDPEDVTNVVVTVTRDGRNGPMILEVTEGDHSVVEYELPNTVQVPTLSNVVVIYDDNMVPAALDTVGNIEFVNNSPTHYYFRVDSTGAIHLSAVDETTDEEASFVIVAA